MVLTELPYLLGLMHVVARQFVGGDWHERLSILHKHVNLCLLSHDFTLGQLYELIIFKHS